MTPDQIDTLAQMIANSLPGLVKEKTGPQSKPMQPKNIRSLYVEKDNVKNVIAAALKGLLRCRLCRSNWDAGPKPRALCSLSRLGPPRLQERSSCSIAFSRFLRARFIALAALGAILPAEISVSILR